MDYKKASIGLGVLSVGLGLVELLAPGRITRALGVEGHEGIVKAFGARELFAGAGIFESLAHSARVWNRVAGDAMDLGALGLALGRSEKQGAVAGALAFVVGVTILDVIVAKGLDDTTGRFLPDPATNG